MADMSEREYNKNKIRQAWKRMTILEKIDYIWTYYKPQMAVVVLAFAAIWLGVTMYRGITTEVLLNVVIVGAESQDTETLEAEFAEYADIDEEEGIVRIRTSISADTEDKNSVTALSTVLGANDVDVLICPWEVYEKYDGQGGFSESRTLEKGNYLEKLGLTSYAPVYVSVVANGENKEMAERFLLFLVDNTN